MSNVKVPNSSYLITTFQDIKPQFKDILGFKGVCSNTSSTVKTTVK